MKFRKPLKITSRTSTITNSFVQAIIPTVVPNELEVDEALAILGMERMNISCVYCGARSSDWDHLRPLVKDKRPTGYISEIRNLVPSCGPCNQSKSGRDWREWMVGRAKGSPTSRNVLDIQERISRLDAYEKWGAVTPLSFEEMIDLREFEIHWDYHTQIHDLMRAAQQHADSVRATLAAAFLSRQKETAPILTKSNR